MALRNNPLDDIVKCNVEITEPASDDASFNSILIVIPAPAAAGTLSTSKTFSVSKADELLDYGYSVNDSAYFAAEAAFAQNPAPDKLYFCVRQKVAVGSGESATTEYEDIKATLARANGEAGFYGVHLSEFRTRTDVEGAAAWTEANEKILGFEYASISSCPTQNFSYYRTFGIFSGQADGYGSDVSDQPKANEFAALAWMAKCFGYDPGSETWNLKSLASIVPSVLSSADKTALERNNINSFLRYAGSNVTIGGKTLAGEGIDVIRFRDWLKNAMQVNVFNVLKTNRKVPYTDEGIAMIQGAMETTLASGQTVGGIAATQYDEDGNEIPGFTVTVPRSADVTDVQRKSRKLTGCKYTARLAGAIHVVEIDGYLTF